LNPLKKKGGWQREKKKVRVMPGQYKLEIGSLHDAWTDATKDRAGDQGDKKRNRRWRGPESSAKYNPGQISAVNKKSFGW